MPRFITAGIVALLICSAPIAYAQRSEREIAELFGKAAQQVFDEAGAAPSPDSARLLADLLRGAARRMVADNRTADSQVAEAAAAVRRFAAEMVKNGTRQDDGKVRLGESSFAAALRSLCPVYPVC